MNARHAPLLLLALAAMACGAPSSSSTSAAQGVAVDVNPSSADVLPHGTVGFAATVTGTTSSSVQWSVQETGGGTVNATGLYVAPAAVGTYHVVVASAADPTVKATAIVTVTATPTVAIAISPTVVTVLPSQSYTFAATVTGSTNTGALWTVQETSGCGSITSTGVYVAPSVAATCHVVATSQADATKSATATVTVAAAAAATAVNLGVNVEGVANYSAPFFADYVKQGRAFNVIGNLNSPAPVDANGWPTGDAEILIGTGPAEMARPDPYKLSFQGNATVTSLGATVSNQVYSAATNTTTADVLVTSTSATDPHANGNFTLRFAGQAGGVKNVKLMYPGQAPGDLFQRDFLARISYFTTLRLIAWLGPSNGQVTSNTDHEWVDRGLPSYAVQTPHAPAWEFVTLLANATHKDVWIAVPYYASQDYMTKLAQLFKYGSDGVNPYTAPQANPVYPPLEAGRKIYVEYSNEVWNSVYPTTGQVYTDATAQVAAGDPNHLAYDGNTNQYSLGWRLYGRKMMQVSEAFRAVFGDAAMMTVVRPVLARQLANTATFTQPLNYVKAVYGAGNAYGNAAHAPAYWFYAMSGAIYIGNVEGTSVDAIIAAMQTYLTGTLEPAISTAKTLADSYGLALVAYEGGQHLLPQTGSATYKLAAQTDPRMGQMFLDLYHYWYGAGGQLANFYTLCSAWGNYGYWGLSPDITSEATPKWSAVKQVAAGL